MRKRYLLYVFFLLLAGSLAVLLLAGRRIGALAEPYLVEQARRAGVRLALEEPRLDIFGFRAKSASLFMVRALLPVSVDNPSVRISYPALVAGGLKIEFDGGLYGGAFEGKFVSRLLNQENGTLRLTVKDVDAAQHPALQALGVSGGRISVDMPEATFSRGELMAATVKAVVARFQKPRRTVLKGASFGIPFALDIPGFTDLEGTCFAALSPGALAIQALSSRSSLGELEGKGTLQFAGHQLADLNAELRLSEAGRREFGPLLASQSGEDPADPPAEYVVSVRGPLEAGNIEVRAVEP